MENHPSPVALRTTPRLEQCKAGNGRCANGPRIRTESTSGQLSSDDLWVSVCRGEVGCVHGLSRPHVAYVDAVLNAV